MKVVYLTENVDCSVCAANLERAISKLDYIKSASLDFVQLKLYVTTVENCNFTETELTKRLQALTSKVLPNVTLKNINSLKFIAKYKNQNNYKIPEINNNSNNQHTVLSDELLDSLINQTENNVSQKPNKTKHKVNFFSFEFIKIYISIAFLILGVCLPINKYLKLPFYLISYLIVGYSVIIAAVKKIFKGKLLDEKFLTTIASIAAFCIFECLEAVIIMLLFQVGEIFSKNAVSKSKQVINEIVNLKAEFANLLQNNTIKQVNPEDLNIGDTILIKVGDRVPVDSKIIKGESSFDVSSITGESMPKDVSIGEQILSGCINLANPVYATVISKYENSTVAKILDLIENNGQNKANAEKFITKFAQYYTPIIVLIAAIIFALFPVYGTVVDGINRAAVFLVISCPCALVISVPLTYFCALGFGAKHGLLIKGSNVLDNIASLKGVCFDKTGTLTYGKFELTEVNAINCDTNEMLEYLQLAESISNHPIAKCIVNDKNIDSSTIKSSKEILGYGVLVNLNNGNRILCGNEKLLTKYKIPFNPELINGTIIYIALNKRYLGYVVISDIIKENAKEQINHLKNNNIKTIMLTGDNVATAQYVSSIIEVDQVYSNLLPQDKVSMFNKIKADLNNNVAFVGDGVNDTPVLNCASVAYSMGINGSDSAVESSDVVIMNDNISAVNTSIKIAKQTRKLVIENIIFSLSIKLLVMILNIIGITNIYLAIFADVGVSIIAILNSLRIFTLKLKNK